MLLLSQRCVQSAEQDQVCKWLHRSISQEQKNLIINIIGRNLSHAVKHSQTTKMFPLTLETEGKGSGPHLDSSHAARADMGGGDTKKQKHRKLWGGGSLRQ